MQNMKKTIFGTMLFSCLLFTSCDVFELDNYEEPKETIIGEVVDSKTGERILTDQGSEGIRVRMTELSWGDNVEHNPDFYCKSDGSFQNTKIFKGTYNIRIDGPFVPIVREDERGVPIANDTKTLDIEGTINVKFEVQPFLKVEFVDYPTVSNGQITARVKVTRGISNDEFREKIEPMGNYNSSFTNVTDIQLFVSYSSSVGYRARDERWSNKIEYVGSEFENLLGKEITIKSIKGQTIPSGKHVFVRAAARINYDTPAGSGTRRWNYSEPMEVIIP
jgi:hypothetical protein